MMRTPAKRITHTAAFAVVIILLMLTSCQAPAPGETSRPQAESTSAPTQAPTEAPATEQEEPDVAPDSAADSPQLGLTYLQPDGNRVVAGAGSMPSERTLDISLESEPTWIVSAPYGNGSLWVVTLIDGRIQAFTVQGDQAAPMPLAVERLPAGMPPLLQVEGEKAGLLALPHESASPVTHPVPLQQSARQVFVSTSGDLVLWDGEEVGRLDVNALPDARILRDEDDRLLAYTDATDTRYTHGVLGDRLEAASISLVETDPEFTVARKFTLDAPQVFEGISPIWTDIDGDGEREIVATVSDGSQGAQIVVYDESGAAVAAGPPIGRGSRWRHQLAVAPFGPAGEVEISSILTPHIGGVAEFYATDARGEMPIIAQVPGYSSHALGMRNLDMGLAGDVDGDGRIELLVPDQVRKRLGAIRRTEGGAMVAWDVPLGGHLTTNLAAVPLADGSMVIGAGRADGTLRLWLPEEE